MQNIEVFDEQIEEKSKNEFIGKGDVNKTKHLLFS